MLSTGEPTVPLEKPQLSTEGSFLLKRDCVRRQSRASFSGRLHLNDAAQSRCPRDSQEAGPRQGAENESPTAKAKQRLNTETSHVRGEQGQSRVGKIRSHLSRETTRETEERG